MQTNDRNPLDESDKIIKLSAIQFNILSSTEIDKSHCVIRLIFHNEYCIHFVLHCVRLTTRWKRGQGAITQNSRRFNDGVCEKCEPFIILPAAADTFFSFISNTYGRLKNGSEAEKAESIGDEAYFF